LRPTAFFWKHPAMRALVALLLLAAATAPAAVPPTAYIADLLDSAKADYAKGHLDSAFAKLKERDKAQGASGESLDLRGSIALEEGKFAEAEQAFNAAHKLEPELFAPRLHLGDLDLREKKYEDARELYQRLASETNILTSNERVRYGLLIADLALHNEAAAQSALENIKFPTETPAYYFAQAAWEFAHGNESSAKKWLSTAHKIFPPDLFAWFARPLYDLGWIKTKPPPPTI
jgi:tetratricopeptide (TPR) repeat protein